MSEKKEYDSYEMVTTDQGILLDEIRDMEAHSVWEPGIIAKDIRLEAIEAPIFAAESAKQYGLDADMMQDTAESTKLLADYYGQKYMIRDTARPTLGETAKLYGAALSRMEVPLMAETLNNGLSVARGNTLILNRYGKASAFHSDGEGGYQIMEISRLFEIAMNKLGGTFGELVFESGYNSHGYTTALWSLPDVQGEILDIYEDALTGCVSRNFAVNMMPGVRLSSSDTATSCACLTPVFLVKQGEYRMINGLNVKHTKRIGTSGKSGLDAFEEGAGEMYAQFQASVQVVSKLAQTRICHGPNAVVSLCRRYGIAKMYGDTARQLVDRLTDGGTRSVSAHDLYLCMLECVETAKDLGAKQGKILNLQEAIAKIPNADWAAHDVGGVVAWSN